MELSLRTVLVILGSLFMLGILVDGFRRMRRARQEALKIDVQGNFQFPEEGFSSELPNGGARIIGDSTQSELLEEAYAFKDQLDELPGLSALDEADNGTDDSLSDSINPHPSDESVYSDEDDFQIASYSDSHTEEKSENNSIDDFDFSPESDFDEENHDKPDENISEEVVESTIEVTNSTETSPINLDEHVPLLMDVEELGLELDPLPVSRSSESLFETVLSEPSEEQDADHDVESDISKPEILERQSDDQDGVDSEEISSVSPESETDNTLSDQDNAVEKIEEMVVPEGVVSEGVEAEVSNNGRQYVEDMTTQAAYAPVKKPGPNAEVLADREPPSLVLITHVVPHDKDGFCGEDILYLVNNCDLRHGEKGIFHRFENPNGEGRVQFSMANSFNPGTFDPETMLHERIYGLSLFLSLPGPEKAMDAFEAMSEMASVIARNLGGEVHDETHSIMALQTIEHNRQQVRDFVRRQKIAGKK